MISPVRAMAAVLVGLVIAGCNSSEDRLRDEVKESVAANLAERKDIAESDKEAAAEAIAEDVVQLKREFEELQPQIDENNARLERELPSQSELIARECEQRRLELEALRRLSQDPTSMELDPGEREALPDEIRRAEAGIAERCRPG